MASIPPRSRRRHAHLRRHLRPHPRPRLARSVAAVTSGALLLGLAAGCGQTQEEGADRSGPSERPTQAPRHASQPALVSVSQGGGTIDAPPVVIESAADAAELTAGLEAGLPELVESRARELLPQVPEGQALVGKVVWVGCETPADVRVEGTTEDPSLTAVVPDKGSVQCLVPVTTVALAMVPEA